MKRANYEPKQNTNGVWQAIWAEYPEPRDQFGPFISREAAQRVCDRLNPTAKARALPY